MEQSRRRAGTKKNKNKEFNQLYCLLQKRFFLMLSAPVNITPTTSSKTTPSKTPATLSKDKVNNELPDFDEESTKLLQEMRSNVNEERLLRIKNLDLKKRESSSKRFH